MPKRRPPGAGRDHRGGHDPVAGLPVGRYDPLTPAGEQEQLGKLISGLSRGRGWRRVAGRLAAVIALVAIVAVIVIGVAHSFG